MIANPHDMHAAFIAAANAGALDQLCDLYEPNALVIASPGEPGADRRFEGAAAVREHLRALLSMRPTMTILASQVQVKDDLALMSSHWRATVQFPNGDKGELEGRGSELARRQADGSWRLVIDNPGGAD